MNLWLVYQPFKPTYKHKHMLHLARSIALLLNIQILEVISSNNKKVYEQKKYAKRDADRDV